SPCTVCQVGAALVAQLVHKPSRARLVCHVRPLPVLPRPHVGRYPVPRVLAAHEIRHLVPEPRLHDADARHPLAEVGRAVMLTRQPGRHGARILLERVEGGPLCACHVTQDLLGRLRRRAVGDVRHLPRGDPPRQTGRGVMGARVDPGRGEWAASGVEVVADDLEDEPHDIRTGSARPYGGLVERCPRGDHRPLRLALLAGVGLAPGEGLLEVAPTVGDGGQVVADLLTARGAEVPVRGGLAAWAAHASSWCRRQSGQDAAICATRRAWPSSEPCAWRSPWAVSAWWAQQVTPDTTPGGSGVRRGRDSGCGVQSGTPRLLADSLSD